LTFVPCPAPHFDGCHFPRRIIRYDRRRVSPSRVREDPCHENAASVTIKKSPRGGRGVPPASGASGRCRTWVP
jgi:hypothetical protein